MSIFIHSDDFKTGGSSSDGEWTFKRSIRGNWNVIGQHMESQTIPWLYVGNNLLTLRIANPVDPLEYSTLEVTFDAEIGLLTDLGAIASQLALAMQATIDANAMLYPYAARTVTPIPDSTTQTIRFNFTDDPVDVLWEGDAEESGFLSTINGAVGHLNSPNELSVTATIFHTYGMTTDPKYLEIYIAESSTQISTSHGTRPTLMFSTRDGEFTGQNLIFPKDGNTMTIQIKRMGSDLICPLNGSWYLVLQTGA